MLIFIITGALIITFIELNSEIITVRVFIFYMQKEYLKKI